MILANISGEINTFAMGSLLLIYAAVISYLGFRGFKKTRSSSDYLLAGRSVNPFAMAMSYGAAFISTSALVGFGGIAGEFGMGLMWLVFMNIAFGIIIAFIWFGKRTRRIGLVLDAKTFPEFIGNRFQSDRMKYLIAGVIFFVCLGGGGSLVCFCRGASHNVLFSLICGSTILLVAIIFLYIKGLSAVMLVISRALVAALMVGGSCFLIHK